MGRGPLPVFPAEEEPALPAQPQELRTRLSAPPGPLGSALRAALTDRGCLAQEHNFLRGLQIHNHYLENTHFCRWKGKACPGERIKQLNKTSPQI